MTDPTPSTLPAWLQAQKRLRGAEVALRHKRLGVWQVLTLTQVHSQVLAVAGALQRAGFGAASSLVIVSRPRPEALLGALAAQWLGGVAVLLDPLDEASAQQEVVRRLAPDFLFVEGLSELTLATAAGLTPGLLFYADGRGIADPSLPSWAQLAAQAAEPLQPVQARPQGSAFGFHRLAAGGVLESQHLSHAQVLEAGRLLVATECLVAEDEALAARAFATSGQARYLLGPWLLAGFRLNFPETLATRDNDRRELGPTFVLGTRHTYGRLHEALDQRLPVPGSLSRHLVDWALAPGNGLWQRTLGQWLIRKPLRDALGLSRARVPLLVGAPLDPAAQALFVRLGVEVRAWPDAPRWQSTQDAGAVAPHGALQPV